LEGNLDSIQEVGCCVARAAETKGGQMATTAKDAGLVSPDTGAGAAAPWPGWVHRLKHALGLDRAIAYTVLARVVQILGSTGTVLLILRFLTPIEQGYYYTLLGLASLQMVFELGFSFVILQMAAHECARLSFRVDGGMEGDANALARLSSILQKTLRWYSLASVILCVSLLPAGAYFFSRHARVEPAVAWKGPWGVLAFATVVFFLLNPFVSFLEGCGQVWQVGRMRFGQAVLGAGMSWGMLLSHHGLYSPGTAIAAYAVVSAAFVWLWRRPLLRLLRDRINGGAVSWQAEVWPFQWRIAVSWICSYLSVQIFTPMLFANRGPTEAGQFGMSLSITVYLSTLVLAWMSTKATPFGKMIARGEFQELSRLFFRTLRQSLMVLVGMSALCELGVIGLPYVLPGVAVRMVSPGIFVLMLLTCISGFVVQSMAIYLRSFKREPFLAQSTIVAVLTLTFVALAAKTWGVAGGAASYFLSTGVIGLVYGTVVFRRKCTREKIGSLPLAFEAINGGAAK
jgi:hypothetical protein